MRISQIETASSTRYPDVTGVLLAGGLGRRLGRDKALLALHGRPLYRPALDLLQRFFERVLIAGDRPDLARPEIPSVPDFYPGSALGGLHTGLKSAATEWIFVAPCDMPFPDGRIVERLLARRGGCDAVVPRTPAGCEPVFALYHRNCLAPMEALLQRQRFRISDFFSRTAVRYLDPPELPDGWRQSLLNVNTLEELAVAESIPAVTPPVVSVVARSGTGKTTLLEKLIAGLKARGYRVGAVKHDAHSFSIDHPGKDSWRLTQAGADTMLITSAAQIAMVKRNPLGEEPPLAETIAGYCGDLDIVLTEGFKRSDLPKIEVHRQACGDPLLCRGEEFDPHLIAVASDGEPQLDVPVFHIDDAAGICELLIERYLS